MSALLSAFLPRTLSLLPSLLYLFASEPTLSFPCLLFSQHFPLYRPTDFPFPSAFPPLSPAFFTAPLVAKSSGHFPAQLNHILDSQTPARRTNTSPDKEKVLSHFSQVGFLLSRLLPPAPPSFYILPVLLFVLPPSSLPYTRCPSFPLDLSP